MTGERRALDALVASKDRDFLRLARTVLRSAGHDVATTSVCSERVGGQVRLRAPRVLLLDADCATVDAVRAAAASSGTAVLRLTDDPLEPAQVETPAPVHKWGTATRLLAVIEAASFATDTRPVRARLRLVGP